MSSPQVSVTGGGRPRRRVFAVWIVLVAIAVTAAAAGIVVVFMRATGTAASSSATLPRHIGRPGLLTASVLRSPLGAASVAYGSAGWSEYSLDVIGLVGAGSDSYRVLHTDSGPVGLGSVLSDDGRTLAVEGGLVDLVSGRETPFPAPLRTPGEIAIPQAWAPDNRHLAIVTYVAPEADPIQSEMALWIEHLDILDTATGDVVSLPSFAAGRWLPGWAVAYAPDCTELAYQTTSYQTGSSIHVVTAAGAEVSTFAIPADTYLAGKGAWTADGRSLMLASGSHCSCGNGYPARWSLTTVDATTGRQRGPGYTFDGAYAIRVLGRWHGQRPAVAVYDAEPDTPVTLFEEDTSREDLTTLADVRAVRLVEAVPDADMPVLLSTAPHGAESIDVAGDVLDQGASRPGDPPLLTVDFLITTGVAAVLVLIAAAVTIVVITTRRRRRQQAGVPRPARPVPDAPRHDQQTGDLQNIMSID